MKTFRPISDRVLVKPPDKETVSEGGIVIPDTTEREKPQQGTILAVGPGRRVETGEIVPMNVKVGDSIVFGSYAGIDFKVQGQTYVIMHEEDILMVEEEGVSDAQDASG